MIRGSVMVLVLVAAVRCFGPWATAQDNPILQERLEQRIVEELSQHDSQGKAWYREKNVHKEKSTSGKLLGRKIRLASWTEQSKTWLWLDDPQHALKVHLERLAVRDGRIEFAFKANTKAGYRVWARIPNLAKAGTSGTVRATIHIEGSAALGESRLEQGKITKLDVVLDDLRFKHASPPIEEMVEDALNDYVKDKNDKLRGSLERAINRVQF